MLPRAMADGLYHHRALAHYESGCYEKAIEDWLQVLKLEQGDPFTHGSLGDAYEKLGAFEQACAMYSQAIDTISSLEKSGWHIKDARPANFLVPLYTKRAQDLKHLGREAASEEDQRKANSLESSIGGWVTDPTNT